MPEHTAPTSTMTSRELADLVEKRHDKVKRTIDTLAEKGVISHPQIVGGEDSANGVVERLYRIGKRDSYVVVARLSPAFTARVADRWQELDDQARGPNAAPKGDALDRLAASDRAVTITEAAVRRTWSSCCAYEAGECCNGLGSVRTDDRCEYHETVAEFDANVKASALCWQRIGLPLRRS